MVATRRQTRSTTVEVPLSSISNGGVLKDPALEERTASNTASLSYSPFLPTRLEAILLAVYPITLVLGSLFSILNSTARNAPYSSVSQSHHPDAAPSYFAKKSNVFNVYFVKLGWLWTSVAFILFIFTHGSLGPRFRPTITRRRLQAALRFTSITLVWIFVTQWFFGPPIVDRGFTWTGGKCEIIYGDDPESQRARAGMSDAKEALTNAACKAIGGKWKGGHDISGHVFLLILGSAMLWLELLPAMLKMDGLREARRVKTKGGLVRSASFEGDGEPATGAMVKEVGIGAQVSLGVAALMWWMLLMTAAYFHTWFEKATGLLVAFAAIYTIYFLPRAVPAMRGVLGLPGV